MISYSSTLSALEKASSGSTWRLALDFFEAMEQKQLQRDVIVCNAAISACGDHWKDALALWMACGIQGETWCMTLVDGGSMDVHNPLDQDMLMCSTDLISWKQSSKVKDKLLGEPEEL